MYKTERQYFWIVGQQFQPEAMDSSTMVAAVTAGQVDGIQIRRNPESGK
jgi:hypothetical protein